jgi:UV DNA damage repair endonuclease
LAIKKIGFACKWIDRPDQVAGIKSTDACKELNTGTTTVAWLNRQTREVGEQRLWDLMVQNIEATHKLIKRVGSLDEHRRMVRISSDILPVYTEPTWGSFWHRSDVRLYCEKAFDQVGVSARELGVRLSFHPGQFTVLASSSEGIVSRSIEEFEYHADMVRWMGYGRKFQDFKINVHIAGREGPEGIRRAYKRLSPEARNCITVENEENAWGLEDCLELSDIIPTVLDVHHFWVREGIYIKPDSIFVDRVLASWQGVRPTMHYSLSREDYLVGHDTATAPDYKALLESGYKKSKMRAHSDFYWNTATNDWVLGFLDKFDIMCESKAKNLASSTLHARATELGLFS